MVKIGSGPPARGFISSQAGAYSRALFFDNAQALS
jgi:hypothetical protein